mmetsp:Transcript_962/g.3187  ORF Transcript_962/g.3187 Transcript_962/m.3187 type:complete len:353 (+) Transcript_962:50-1108(+)
MGPATVDTIFGQIYVSAHDEELGIGSYHFVSETEAYISYENEKCKNYFPRLDNRGSPGVPGERMPSRMPFHGASWDPCSRTFHGTVSFSIDMGSYEQVRTVDGVEREEYLLVFSDDFEDIVDGHCRSWFPNASRWHRCERFGEDLRYTRWSQSETPQQPPQVELNAFDRAPQRGGAVGRGATAAATAAADAAAALLARDAQTLQRALVAGASPTTEVDSPELWRLMRWEPGAEWHAAPPRTPLLAAAILLQWPEGVHICVLQGASVNGVYAGPFRLAGGGVGGVPGGAGVPMLRLGLSARSQAQCLICRYVLDGAVDENVFKRLKRKEHEEMEFDTKDLFRRWVGPFVALKS